MIVWGLGSRLDWTLFPQGKPWHVLSNNNDAGGGDDIDHDHDNNYNIYNKAGHLLLF